MHSFRIGDEAMLSLRDEALAKLEALSRSEGVLHNRLDLLLHCFQLELRSVSPRVFEFFTYSADGAETNFYTRLRPDFDRYVARRAFDLLGIVRH